MTQDISYRRANRRYIATLMPLMVFYAVFCFVGPTILRRSGHPPPWAVVLVAVVNAAPIIGVYWLIARFLRETDEYTRKIQTEAMLAGGAVLLSLLVVWSFLDLYKVVPRWLEMPLIAMVGPAFFGAWGLAFLVQHIRRK